MLNLFIMWLSKGFMDKVVNKMEENLGMENKEN